MKLLKNKIFVSIIIVLFAVFMLKDFIFSWGVGKALSKVLGTRVEIGSASLGIISGSAKIKNIRVYQPQGFGGGLLLDAPLIQGSVKPLSIIAGEPHIRKLIIDIRDVQVVRDKNGVLNVDKLKVAKVEKEDKKPDVKVKWRIDSLDLSIYRVVSKDLSGQRPSIEAHELNIKNAHFENIQSAEALVSIILMQSLQSAAIKGALMYGAATALGVSVLPVGAAFLLTGNSESHAELNVSADRAYDAALETIKIYGNPSSADKKTHSISADVMNTQTQISIQSKGWGKCTISVSSKQLILPKPKVAAGILYQIEEMLR